MIAFAEYLIKVTICSAVLTGYYWLALRNKVFHQWNRFYMLAAICISLLLPFVKFTLLPQPKQETTTTYQVLESFTTNEKWFEEDIVQTAPAPSMFTIEFAVMLLYITASVIMLVFTLAALFKIAALLKKYPNWKLNGLVFVDTDAKGTPFSFLRFIFWNNQIDFQSEKGQQIFSHELVHIKEKHSWDKLFLSVVLILFWMNPFFWLIKKELTMIHEFIADRKSVKDGDTSAFAAMILATAFPGYTLQITNPFFYSPIKRRLLMLSKLNNPKVGYISRLLLLPVLTFLFVAFAVKTKEKQEAYTSTKLEKEIVVVIDAGHGLKDGKPDGTKAKDGYSEDEFAFSIAEAIGSLNQNEQIKILFSRKDENIVGLRERIEFVTTSNADLLISLHAISAPGIKDGEVYKENPKRGIEAYISKNNLTFNTQSSLLGTLLLSELSAIMNPNLGIKTRKSGVFIIDQSPCPAVLLECGFLSNKEDVKIMKTRQKEIAAAILKAIEAYALARETGELTMENLNTVQNDTLPSWGENFKLQDQNNNMSIIADSIVIASPGKNDVFEKGIFIVNGKIVTPASLKHKILTADKMTVYPPNNPAMIRKYGQKAKDGVVIVENGILQDEPKQLNKNDALQKDNTPVFTLAEEMPHFPGGDAAWNEHIQNYMSEKYDELIREGKSVNATVRFIVETDGSIHELSITNNNNQLLNEIVSKAILEGPKWIPATQNGNVVRCWQEKKVSFSIPVAEPGNNISGVANARMNVLYVGVDNPLVISTADIAAANLIVSTNNGTVSKVNGEWIAKPATKGEAIITIADKTSAKKQEFLFKVKLVPDPLVTIGGHKGGRMPVDKFRSATQLEAEEEWEITSYVIYLTGAGFESPKYIAVKGKGIFTDEVKQLIAKVLPGTTITIDEVAAKMKNSDIKRRVPGLFFNLY
jgi:N-acetylmuramoyl-L-alanine amidase